MNTRYAPPLQQQQKALLEIGDRERVRLGQDLHDGLSQILAGAKLIVGGLKEKHPELAMVESRLSAALSYVDTISRGLYPVELEANGLVAALQELTLKTSQAYNVACHFYCRRPIFLKDTEVANHLYRIVQEAVMNAIKGGHASRINVRLSPSDGLVLLQVADNGSGFGNGPKRKGMGLQIMQYRAQAINGKLQFKSRLRGGTRLSCSFSYQGDLAA
jgi:two-component system, LuxR family, sensor kinase FixL